MASALLIWQSSPQFQYQNIMFKKVLETEWVLLDTVDNTVESYVAENLQDNTAYDFRVDGVCDNTCLPPTNVIKVNTIIAPTTVQVSGIDYTSFDFSVPTVGGDVNQYVVTLYDENHQPIDSLTFINPTGSAIEGTFENLEPTHNYYVEVTTYITWANESATGPQVLVSTLSTESSLQYEFVSDGGADAIIIKVNGVTKVNNAFSSTGVVALLPNDIVVIEVTADDVLDTKHQSLQDTTANVILNDASTRGVSTYQFTVGTSKDYYAYAETIPPEPAHVNFAFDDQTTNGTSSAVLLVDGTIVYQTTVDGGFNVNVRSGKTIEVRVLGGEFDRMNLVGTSTDTLLNLNLLNQDTNITQTFVVAEGVTYNLTATVIDKTYTACATFGPVLTGVSGQAISLMKAGTLTLTTGTIGNYAIEWYLNSVTGSPKFTSGTSVAYDSQITVIQPFANEPVEGGTWYPVIKSVEVNGIKYTKTKIAGARYSPDLVSCLPTIVIQNMACANGGNFFASQYGGPAYAHKISYFNGTTSPTLAARSLRFDLDATNRIIAWRFQGYQVADYMKISYVSPANGNTKTQIENWYVGTNSGSANQTVNPRIANQVYMFKMTNISSFTFAAGDYLLIEITPNSVNSNTDWEFLIKCFSSVTFDLWDANLTHRLRKIVPNTVAMTWNASACQYEVTYQREGFYPNYSSSIYWQYNMFQIYGAVNSSTYTADKEWPIIYLKKSVIGSAQQFISPQNPCTQLGGQITANKTSGAGNPLVLTFSNSADYNFFKTAYNNAINSTNANWTNYTTDQTSINYYKFLYISLLTSTVCTDSGMAQNNWYFHRSSSVVFNDVGFTISITPATMTNNYVNIQPTCDSAGATVSSYVGLNNSMVNNTTNNIVTNVRWGSNPFGAIYLSNPSVQDLTVTTHPFYGAYGIDTSIVDLSQKGWTNQRMPFEQFEYSEMNEKVTITNSADPINNWRLERMMDDAGVFITNSANYIKVYEIVNGVRTV